MTESGDRTDSSSSNFFNAWFVKLDESNRVFWQSGRCFIVAQLLVLLSLLLLITLVTVSALPANAMALLSPLIPWILLAAIGLLLSLAYSIWKTLLDPLLRLCEWADLMRGVNLDAKVEFTQNSDFNELGNDINMLGNMIKLLSRETEVQLEKHTDYISRESRSLSILYDVTSSINIYNDLNELFEKSLESLCENLPASAGIIRQFTGKKKLDIVASYGQLNNTFLASVDRLLPIGDFELNPGRDRQYYRVDSLANSTKFNQALDFIRDHHTVLSIYIQYREETLGVIHLFFPDNIELDPESYKDLFISIGQHLGTAVEKHRLGDEENRLFIIQERNRLSHELHDSLAQTLASLRIQIRVMDEIVLSNDEQSIWHQMERIEYTIDRANSELRELIENFRIPMHEQGFITSVEETIQKNRDETEITIYFQNEWSNQELTSNEELNILRIVQESLANIRKHSEAKVVRVHFWSKEGINHVLIEDDGIGFEESTKKPEGGQHIGLTILRDRALQINGNISIESEPNEGTRIHLQFEQAH
jgi:two-component system nitrate/nitrite sensor histidine kinase NarX